MYRRISDSEVFKTLESMKNKDENVMSEVFKTLILLALDIRHFLRKIYKEKNKKLNNLVTDPLKAKKGDIVIGEDK